MRPATVKALWILSGLIFTAYCGAKVLTFVGSQSSQTVFLRHVSDASKEIQQIILESPLEKITLDKQSVSWVMSSPEEYPADGKAVEEILRALSEARVEDKISAGKEKWPDFELDDNRAIRLSVKAGGRVSLSGRIGKPVSGGFDRSYFVFDGAEDIYIVKLPRYYLERRSNSLKDRLILEAPKEKIISLEIRRGKDSLEMAPTQGGWSANGKLLDEKKAMEILSPISRLEAAEFASASEIQDRKKIGLDKSAKEFSLTINLKDGKAYTLMIGEKKDAFYYAKLSAKPTVWKILDSKILPLETAFKELTAPVKKFTGKKR